MTSTLDISETAFLTPAQTAMGPASLSVEALGQGADELLKRVVLPDNRTSS